MAGRLIAAAKATPSALEPMNMDFMKVLLLCSHALPITPAGAGMVRARVRECSSKRRRALAIGRRQKEGTPASCPEAVARRERLKARAGRRPATVSDRGRDAERLDFVD